VTSATFVSEQISAPISGLNSWIAPLVTASPNISNPKNSCPSSIINFETPVFVSRRSEMKADQRVDSWSSLTEASNPHCVQFPHCAPAIGTSVGNPQRHKRLVKSLPYCTCDPRLSAISFTFLFFFFFYLSLDPQDSTFFIIIILSRFCGLWLSSWLDPEAPPYATPFSLKNTAVYSRSFVLWLIFF
jgi:hypothetical protein